MTYLVGGISSAARALPVIDGVKFSVDRSKGPYIWAADGKRYVDTALGFGATILGHGHPAVIDAVQRAIARGPMPAFAHDLEEEAAAALARHTGTLSRIIFVNTGSEAVHLAMRAARAHTGRGTIAKFAAGYDGWYDNIAFGNVNSAEAAMVSNRRPVRDGITLLRYNDKSDVDLLFAENPDIAAILVEPVLANAGTIVPQAGYLQHLAATARAHGALVIADEVLMGFRLHPGLSTHALGIEPDMAALGKAIGSGFVVAAVAGRPEIMACFEDQRVARAGTYNGNPVACAAVCATMAALERSDYPGLLETGNTLRRTVETAFADHGLPVSTTGYGSVFTLWKGETPPRDYQQAVKIIDPGFTAGLHEHLRGHGVVSIPQPFGRHYLSFAHDPEALSMLAEGFSQAAGAMAKQGARVPECFQ